MAVCCQEEILYLCIVLVGKSRLLKSVETKNKTRNQCKLRNIILGTPSLLLKPSGFFKIFQSTFHFIIPLKNSFCYRLKVLME